MQQFTKIGLISLAALAGASLATRGSAAGGVVRLPDPPGARAATHARAVAVLAGGCFWGMEGLFEHVRGVARVTSGYAGGTAATANYPAVSAEGTAHAEAIRIEYDPAQVSYGELLKVYFGAAHDPTQVNAQYPDSGSSYRSAIFPQNAAQRAEAVAYIAAINRAHAFKRPLATRIEGGSFYPAETYHQQFMRKNPTHPYIVAWDVPRLARFRSGMPELYQR